MNLLKLVLETPYHIVFALIGILGIALLIGIHEMGHFLFAKLFNVHTPSFSIGFGPRILSKKIGTTDFSISAIPLGGYVEISGMAEVGQGEQKNAQSKGEDSFGVKPYWQKMLILFGGILFNLLFAYFSLALLFIVGAPKTHMLAPLGIVSYKPIIHAVMKDSPAEKAQLQPGDEIVSVNVDSQTSGILYRIISTEGNAEQLTKTLKAHPDETVRVGIKRGENETLYQDLALGSAEISENGEIKKIGIWGAQLEINEIPTYSFGQAIAQGIHATNIYILTTIYAFKNMFVKRDIKGVGGPIMIIAETMKGAQKGFKIFLLFLAIISINLAVLNLLPLPILDGGQIMFVTIETLIGKQLPKLREYIHIGSWLLMLALIIFLTVRDLGILKLFGVE